MTISPSTTDPAGSCSKQRVVKLGKVAIERPEVAALNVDVGLAAKDDRPEAVPFGLVEEAAAGWQRLGELREHRLDWRRDGEHWKSLVDSRQSLVDSRDYGLTTADYRL